MKNQFIITENVEHFDSICVELEGAESQIGPSLAMVTGPAGRGKSEAARHYATNSSAVYIPPLNKRTGLMLLKTICFELAFVKPGRTDACVDLISEEMARSRRLIILDEADLLPISIIEMIRNINEICGCPVVLMGEQELKGKIGSRRRLASRIRRKIEFSPLSQADIVLFFRKNMGVDLTAVPEAISLLHEYSKGDWRPVLVAALDIERAMIASGISDASIELIKGVLDGRKNGRS